MPSPSIAVTGASGFVGRNLVSELCRRGLAPRAISRDSGRLEWARALGAEPVTADLLDGASLARALAGIRVAYYLVHSMEPDAVGAYAERDRRAAQTFAQVARQAGVQRVIYLGGLGRSGLSEHLASRVEVGRLLKEEGPPLTAVHAGIIIGAGSSSFQMLRDLTFRLPAMVTPRWVHTRTQPVALEDVIGYLCGVLERPETAGHRYDVGTPEVLTYAELIRCVAAVSHRRPPLIVPVPVLTPRLSSYWVRLVTAVPSALSRPLIEGLATEAVAEFPERLAQLLGLRRTPVREAIALALGPSAGRAEARQISIGSSVHLIQRYSFPTRLRLDQVAGSSTSSPERLARLYLDEPSRLSLGVIRSRWRPHSVRLQLAPAGPSLITLTPPVAAPLADDVGGMAVLHVTGGLLTRAGSSSKPGRLVLRWSIHERRLEVEADLEVSYRAWYLVNRGPSRAAQVHIHEFVSARALRRIATELALRG